MSKLSKILFLISGISAMILFVARLIVGGWLDVFYAPLFIASVGFFLALVNDYKFYYDFLTMRTTKHGMNMGVLILMAFVLMVAVNYLGIRFDKTFDLTKEKINSLSDQSVTVVQNLKSDLNVMVFYKTKKLKEAALEIKSDFAMYERVSPKVKTKLVNADLDVDLAKKYLLGSEAFSTVVEYNGHYVVIQPQPESPKDRPVYLEANITAAIIKATRETPMNIYFLTGHGEKDIDTQALDGLKLFAGALKDDGYNVAKLNLLMGDKMPDTNSVLAIIGPRTTLADNELDQIRKFLKEGGRLLLAIDPGEKHQLALLTKSLGVEFGNNYVLNYTNSDDGVIGAVGYEFNAESEITKKLVGRTVAVFAYASELKKAPDAPSENSYVELIKSHPESFVYHEPKNLPKNPEKGVHILAMSVKGVKMTAVIFGDSDFLTDFRIGSYAHIDLAMNSVAYLFGDNANLTIRPKKLESTPLQLTESKQIFIRLAGISLPLLLVILSGVTWYRRRNL